jgi:hypothetical protein
LCGCAADKEGLRIEPVMLSITSKLPNTSPPPGALYRTRLSSSPSVKRSRCEQSFSSALVANTPHYCSCQIIYFKHATNTSLFRWPAHLACGLSRNWVALREYTGLRRLPESYSTQLGGACTQCAAFRQEGRTYATIAALLNADAIPSASGKPHTAESVRKALKAAPPD